MNTQDLIMDYSQFDVIYSLKRGRDSTFLITPP